MMPGLAWAALAAGLLGGVHCAGMCGGIAASLSAAARGPALPRQAAFNAGRIASYSLAGLVAGGIGSALQSAAPFLWAQTALFVFANALMVLLGLYVAGWGRAILRLESAGGAVWRRIEPLRRRFVPIDSTARALGAGAVWGWVPCGLVYSMLALALASGSAAGGAMVMAAFGLGTLPTLLLAGLAAQKVLGLRRNAWVRRAAGLAIIAFAVLGLARVPTIQEHLHAGWVCITA
ncbi:MAG TPA: sulfite exporter TauE/SafE family protein [Usitatibacter sp.]|nr:sulfite exporter TauE/SafE family protein [Usitatibacter sp.]